MVNWEMAVGVGLASIFVSLLRGGLRRCIPLVERLPDGVLRRVLLHGLPRRL
ncbi:MAG TPA: hypothetical protein VFH85_01655 [Gammaproteobacteria bacterium]|nr:hypothetical protein [Gammaproteobacteria bacterium]